MTPDASAPGQQPSPAIDTSVPHSARIWNYWLGGKDNYEADRVAGDEYTKAFPGIVDIARAQRYFLARVIRHLAGEVGIRQFLDVGTGLPTVDNTHEVAQRVAPDSRIVYVDNDPLVLAHAHALLTSTPEGATDYIDADLHDPDSIVAAARSLLNLSQPVALTMLGVLGHISDTEEAYAIVRRLLDSLPSGSYLAIADGTNTDTAFVEAQQQYNDSGAVPYILRSPEQIAGFFDGLELVEPGVVTLPRWRPEISPLNTADADELCGLARKP